MSRTVTIQATIRTVEQHRGRKVFYEKTFADHDVMKLSTIRRWVTRQTNRAMAANPGVAIVGEYRGQLKEEPYSFYSGAIGGANGRILSRSGEMDY